VFTIHQASKPAGSRPARRGIAATAAEWSARHRKAVVLGWLAFVLLTVAAGSMAGTKTATTLEHGVGESGRASRILHDAGLTPPAAESVIVQSSTPTGQVRGAVDDVLRSLTATGQVTDVVSPYNSGAVTGDGRSALVTFAIAGDPETAKDRVGKVLDAVTAVQDRHSGLYVAEYGEASGKKWYDESFSSDFARAEWTAVPLAIGILLVAFGAIVAALLPVGLAVTAYLAALGLLGITSHLLHTTDDAYSVMLLVGLAVGVDYCLFYLRRERDERAAGKSREEALRIAAATSGRSVLVSGLTVIIAMAGMLLTGITDFKAMGVATMLVVAVAVSGALTVLPALLSMLGDRVERGRLPLPRRRRRSDRRGRGPLNVVLRYPGLAAAAALVALLALAAPALGMHTAQLTFTQELPKGNQLVVAGERIDSAFPGSASPVTVVITAPDVTSAGVQQGIAAMTKAALATGRMHQPVQVDRHAAQGIVVVHVPLAGSGTDSASEAALSSLRSQVIPSTIGSVAGTTVAVTGSTASSVDFNDRLMSAALPVFAFVVGLAFLLMMMCFRSLTIAVVSVLLNGLSVAAAYGVLTLVFQHGYGAGLLGSTGVGAVQSWMPLFLFVILFGLSMDYHVFVVSRIKEAHDRGLTTSGAVAYGLKATAGVVTSAAVIMVGVFMIFGTLSIQSMKQIGVGLAVAVLLDATIIRLVLLPGLLTVLGERCWYLPRWLGAWLPDLSEAQAEDKRPVSPAITV
jgi:uncharacterized membrane protein YdfJ with MMPL/SSD domain